MFNLHTVTSLTCLYQTAVSWTVQPQVYSEFKVCDKGKSCLGVSLTCSLTKTEGKKSHTDTAWAVADWCDHNLRCLPTVHDWKPKSRANIPVLPPKCWSDAHIWSGDFSLTIFQNDFITQDDKYGCLWLPPELERPLLAKDTRVASFHKGSTLCYVIERLCHHGAPFLCKWDECPFILTLSQFITETLC